MSTKISIPRNCPIADLLFVLQRPEDYEFSSYDIKAKEKQIKEYLDNRNYFVEYKNEILQNLERIVSTVR